MNDKSFQQMINEAVEQAIDRYVGKIEECLLENERLLSITELSNLSGFSATTLRSWITRDYDPLPAFQVDKEYRVRKTDFDQWINTKRVKEKVGKLVNTGNKK